MATRVYVGRLPYRATERDVEKFFRNYGRLSEIILKNGFCFVDFEDLRDAEDAAYELNGKELMGSSLVVEIARGTPRGSDRYRWNPPPANLVKRHSSSSSSSKKYRVIVENLSSRVERSDLKELFRKCGDIISVDAHGRHKNEGYVEFAHREDAEYAVKKFDGYEMEGRKLKVFEEKRRKSRSPSPSTKRRRTPHSRSRSPRENKTGDDEDRKSPNGLNDKERSHSGSRELDKRSNGSKDDDE